MKIACYPTKPGALPTNDAERIQHMHLVSFIPKGGFGPCRSITNDHRKKKKRKIWKEIGKDRSWLKSPFKQSIYLNNYGRIQRIIPPTNAPFLKTITYKEVSILVVSPKFYTKVWAKGKATQR